MKKARREAVAQSVGSEGQIRRILARILAEDLRSVRAGLGGIVPASSTVTDLGDRRDVTFRGGDGDTY